MRRFLPDSLVPLQPCFAHTIVSGHNIEKPSPTNLVIGNPIQVTTEGDAFQFVFHCATDAVAYAIAAQQALMTARWPPELEDHYRTRSRGLADSCSSEDAEMGTTECPGRPAPSLLTVVSFVKIISSNEFDINMQALELCTI